MELLLRRYHTISFLEQMPVENFISFLNLAIKKELEDQLYLQWCAMLPQMGKYMTFSEFYDKLTGKNIDRRSTEDIIAEIEELHKGIRSKDNGS